MLNEQNTILSTNITDIRQKIIINVECLMLNEQNTILSTNITDIRPKIIINVEC